MKKGEMNIQVGNEESCPSTEELVLFSEGALPKRQTESITNHILACEQCLELVSSLTKFHDTGSAMVTEPLSDEFTAALIATIKQRAGTSRSCAQPSLRTQLRNLFYIFEIGSARAWYARPFPLILTMLVLVTGAFYLVADYKAQQTYTALVTQAQSQLNQTLSGPTHSSFRISGVTKISPHDYAKTSLTRTVALDKTITKLQLLEQIDSAGDRLIVSYSLWKGLYDENVGARLDRLLTQNPDDADLLNDKAVWLAGTGQHLEACKLLERCLFLEPEHEMALHNLIYCYHQVSESAPTPDLQVKLASALTRYSQIAGTNNHQEWLNYLAMLIGKPYPNREPSSALDESSAAPTQKP